MSVDELLHTVQYVTDGEGRRQAVLLDLDTWENVIAQLHESDTNLEQGADVTQELAMTREEAAYQAMHQELLKKYFGQHVAVYQGQLVDHDEDGTALYLRVRKQYPGKFVLITPVQNSPEESYVVYSPRLVDSQL